MSLHRQFQLSTFDGERKPYRLKSEKIALIGKRIGYDLRSSCLAHYGTVTGQSRGALEIDGDPISISSIQQVVVLTNQGGTP